MPAETKSKKFAHTPVKRGKATAPTTSHSDTREPSLKVIDTVSGVTASVTQTAHAVKFKLNSLQVLSAEVDSIQFELSMESGPEGFNELNAVVLAREFCLNAIKTVNPDIPYNKLLLTITPDHPVDDSSIIAQQMTFNISEYFQ